MAKQGAFVFAYNKDEGVWFAQLRSKHVGNPLTWCLPGGGIDPGEEPLRAAQREFYEEVGIAPPLGELELVGHLGTHWLYLWEVSDLFDGPRNQEAAAHVWLPLGFMPGGSAPWFPRLYKAAVASIG